MLGMVVVMKVRAELYDGDEPERTRVVELEAPTFGAAVDEVCRVHAVDGWFVHTIDQVASAGVTAA